MTTEQAALAIEAHVAWVRAQPEHLRPGGDFLDGMSEAAVVVRDADEDGQS